MREIKFRVWDVDETTMSVPFGWDTSTTVDFSKWSMSKLDVGDNSRFALMQYTGLKDKNGREIYEGDIVSTRSDSVEIYAVKWMPHLAEYVFHDKTCNHTEWQYAMSQVIEYKDCLLGEWEVIGNIYENPELLDAS